MKNYLNFLKVITIVFTFLFLLPVSAQEKTKPNILFIAIDDLKPILGCYGNTLIKTPNIDRLAKMGTVFMSNYCQQAVCGPTRASIMTGKRPDYTQVWDLKTKMRDINPDIRLKELEKSTTLVALIKKWIPLLGAFLITIILKRMSVIMQKKQECQFWVPINYQQLKN